jgi:hypothetical protein
MRRFALAAWALVALVVPAYADGATDIAAASGAAQAQDFNRAVQLYGHALSDADLTPFNQALAHHGGALPISSSSNTTARSRITPRRSSCSRIARLATTIAAWPSRAPASLTMPMRTSIPPTR